MLSISISKFFWNGINSTLVPGMTSQKPSDGKIGTEESAVPLQRLKCIAGTTGMKTAMLAQHRTDKITIESDQGDQ